MTPSPDLPDSGAAPRDAAGQDARAAAILIGVAAHDLRTPLSAMSGWLQILRSNTELPAATRERAFKGLQMAMAQQIALADGLAMTAGLQSGELAPESAPVDLLAVINSAVAALQEDAGSRLVHLQVDLQMDPGSPGARIESDAGLTTAMVRHLLGAALKFAAKNSSVSIAVSALEAGQGCEVRIELAHSLLPGAGIAALLEYVRGVGGEKPSGAGAAFALSLTQHLARVLGGGIHASAGATPQVVILAARLPERLSGA